MCSTNWATWARGGLLEWGGPSGRRPLALRGAATEAYRPCSGPCPTPAQWKNPAGFRQPFQALAQPAGGPRAPERGDRKSVVQGTSDPVRVDLGRGRLMKKKHQYTSH